MPVYSARLGGPVFVGASAVTFFTVPTGRLYVVRQVDIVVTGGTGTPTITLFYNSAATISNRYWRVISLGDVTHEIQGRRMFAAGETMQATATGIGSGQSVVVSVGGYNLSAS